MPCCPARPLARGPMTSPNRMLTHCGGRNGDKTRNRIATPLLPSSLAASGCQLRPGADPGAIATAGWLQELGHVWVVSGDPKIRPVSTILMFP